MHTISAAAKDFALCFRLKIFTPFKTHGAIQTDARGVATPFAMANLASLFVFSFSSPFVWAGAHRNCISGPFAMCIPCMATRGSINKSLHGKNYSIRKITILIDGGGKFESRNAENLREFNKNQEMVEY